MQLFDAPRSLADAVSHFLIEGRARGDHLLVIARASHWQLIRAYLERRGCPVDDPVGAPDRCRRAQAAEPDDAREACSTRRGWKKRSAA